MQAVDFENVLGPKLSAALARKGYSSLTAVQQAVLEDNLQGRDLRITSQTGSGKTLAIGFALRERVLQAPPVSGAVARPCALVVAPTRELAQQTQAELQWLYADCDAHVVVIAGGASYRDEHRALARGPRVIVVGTPGRLLDHLDRGSIDLSVVSAIVLDEADRLLDMGFKDDLDRIFAHAPSEHLTHLVSATFPRGVRALADKVQADAAHVEGTRLGEANADIDHVLHVIDGRQKVDAIINLLLAHPDMQTLIFARTRADVGMLTDELVRAGFTAGAISGELDQAARNRALLAFKEGRQAVLVATDVAARGIDLQGVMRVIHAEPPTSAVAYTHRAGRTGRAGRKGISSLLITPAQVVPATRLLRAAGIPHRFEPIASAEAIRKQIDQRIFEALTQDAPLNAQDEQDEQAKGAQASAAANDARHGEAAIDPRALALAKKLLAVGKAERIFARLLMRAHYAGTAQPRELRQVAPLGRPTAAGARVPLSRREQGGPAPKGRKAPGTQVEAGVPFRISWGGRQGADARKLLAIVCRRGQIRGGDVGAIRVEADHSIVEVASAVADSFAKHAARPDPRDPRVQIRPFRPVTKQSGAHAHGRKAPKRR
jgi:ATP-dependent RNA helicase DeaD